MKINGASNTTFTGHAFKVSNPTKEMLQEAAFASDGKDYAVIIAKKGKKGDNAMKALLEKAGLKEGVDYMVSKVDYMRKYIKSSDRGVLKQAEIEFNPELAKFPPQKPQIIQYYIPGEYLN